MREEEHRPLIRWAFYEWMAALSIEEIITNAPLINLLEDIERTFRMVDA